MTEKINKYNELVEEIVGDNSENRYSQKEIIKEINRLKDIEIVFNDTKISNYEKAYNLLMDYFDYIPEEEKENLDKQLKELGL